MKIVETPQAFQALTQGWRTEGTVGFVPTMGCLHRGHISLVEASKKMCKKTAVSIFVNPLQFGPKEDFGRYPRPFETDRALLEKAGVDVLFAPTPNLFYPEGFSTQVKVGPLAESLCGAHRPGHFDGVATVCLKLFSVSSCTDAFFGEKDFQQVRILEQMVEDFHLPLKLHRCAIVRDADGLALSSRNQYLSEDERAKAPLIFRGFEGAQEALQKDRSLSAGELIRKVHKILGADFLVDYIALASEKDLKPVEENTWVRAISAPRLFLAARLGTTRLIDNFALELSTP